VSGGFGAGKSVNDKPQKHRVLVIDDDPEMRTLIRRFLQDMSVDVAEAEDGDQGLALLTLGRIDLVVTDILMPGKDGVETIIEIRRRFPDVKIVAMSGGGRVKNMEFLELAGKIGASATLNKPFRREDFKAVVSKLLD
jgi:CheY-like chemotaxis protein